MAATSHVFMDDDRSVLVNSFGDSLLLVMGNVSDIFPALHYFEAHPEDCCRKISVSYAPFSLDGVDAERYVPQLVADAHENNSGYRNYNFVLLDSSVTHNVGDVINGFSRFVSGMRPGKKRVRIKDMDPAHRSGLMRSIRMKELDCVNNSAAHGYFHYSCEGSETAPAMIFLYAEHFSEGLRKRLGIYHPKRAFPDSHLSDRICF